MNGKILWYIADPMCSWCWGFAPVIEQVQSTHGHRLKVELLLGGLRPGTSHSLPPTQRHEILNHWQAVHRATGQPFQFEGAMPEGFIYDTEPASRAVVVVSMLKPEAIFAFFRSVQSAFYVEQRNVTDTMVLAELAGSVRLETQQFLQAFESDAARNITKGHFHKVSQLGVRGFPTLIGQQGPTYTLISDGYCPFTELNPKIMRWLDV
jgi:putative protein-disulfide isomerase